MAHPEVVDLVQEVILKDLGASPLEVLVEAEEEVDLKVSGIGCLWLQYNLADCISF